MYQTLAFAVGVLFIGGFLKKKISILEKFCIPAPVIGGLIFALVSCLLYVFGIVEFNFDETLKNVCMVMFFTSVGFQANLKVLRAGGLSLVIFLACLFVLIVVQNLAAVGLFTGAGHQPAYRNVHRLDTYGWGSRHVGSVRPGARGFRR